MIVLKDIKDIEKIDEKSIVIVPSNYELYYKELYLNYDYKITNLRNFVIENFNGSKKIITSNESYMLMYKALNNVNEKLSLYKDFITYEFVKELINTYEDFYEYEKEDTIRVNDLKLIYEEYEALLSKNNLINFKIVLDEVINNSFNKTYVFLNFDFIEDKYLKLIKKMIEEGCVYFYCSLKNNKNLVDTLNGLGIKVSLEKDDFKNKEISFKALNDVEDELEFIINDISSKLMEGYHYKDFLIVSNDISSYEPYFNLVFNHPYTKKEKTGVLTKRFITYLANILNGDFSCDNFINILKLGLFNISDKMVDNIDNYVYTWDLEKENFYIPFTFNPSGNRKLLYEKDIDKLNEINKAKEDIINPVKYLLENTMDETNKTIILRELYTYLSEEGILDKLFKKDPKGALNLTVLFDTVNDLLDEKTSLLEVINILNNLDLVSSNTLDMQDVITISSMEDMVIENKKFIYLIGASESNLPKMFKLSSLLSNKDITKECLIRKTDIYQESQNYLLSKIFAFDNVIITYHKLGMDLQLKTPSSVISKLNLKQIKEFNIYDKNLMVNSYALKLSNEEIDSYENEEFNKINDSNKHDLNNKISESAAESLYTNNLNVSPSSIETYSKCAFYHFMQYGLRLKVKEKNTFDNREVGTFVHFILENILKNDLDKVDINNLEELVNKYALNYLEDNNKIVNNATKYVIKDLSYNATMIIKNMIKENKIVEFKPRYFELKINDDMLIKPVTLKLLKGSLKISGTVDRVDVYETDNRFYYRIIDYKTGVKKFRLDDVLDGLNLQMLLYLLAIKESNITDKKIVSSALLYYPALVKEKTLSKGLTIEEKMRDVQDRLKMNGIICKDEEVLKALGEEDLGLYVDAVTRGKINEEKVYDLSSLEALFNNIKNTLKVIGNDILSGKATVNPVGGRNDACSFCKFKSICKFDLALDKKRKTKRL